MNQMIFNTAYSGIKKNSPQRGCKLKIALVLYHLPEIFSSNRI